MVWPASIVEPNVTITPWSQEACGALTHIGMTALGAAASAAYPADALAMFFPFYVTKPVITANMFTYNGATAIGNVDVGVYDEAATRLVSSGATAQSGTSTLQTYNITDTLFGPGLFYLAITLDDTGAGLGTLFRGTIAQAMFGRAIGMAQQATQTTLPAAATLAAFAQTYIPLFGLTVRSVV